MRLILIRHGDPDYANDTLTEKGDGRPGFWPDVYLGGRWMRSTVLRWEERRKQRSWRLESVLKKR